MNHSLSSDHTPIHGLAAYDPNNDVLASPTFRSVSSMHNGGQEGHAASPVVNFNEHLSRTISDVTGTTNGNDNPTIQRRLCALKTWGVNTFKCTRQIIEEKLGTATPTCDQDLDNRISALMQVHKQYRILYGYARQLASSFSRTLNDQRVLATHLAILSVQQPELSEGFSYNAETQRIVVSNGEKLLASLDHFVDSLNTLINRTFADTLETIKSMQSARLEYDAYRKDAEKIVNGPALNGTAHQTLGRFNVARDTFLELKSAVNIKLKLLDDNRLRVMHHQLLLLHNATSAYFSGNNQLLEQTLNQFSVKTKLAISTGH